MAYDVRTDWRRVSPKAGRTMIFAHQPGARPLDGYEIQRGVGVGGFGEVYFAKTDAGKEVALKRIQRNLDGEVRGVKQCLNLKHPHLVALYDLKTDAEGQAWVIMEYVSGASLRDVIERHPQGMPIADVARWFRGIAAGVACLHEHEIVHRDLKPANVFDDQGFIKVGDYGLSKFIPTSRRSGHTASIGTVHYMAPEIGRGAYGKEIDVYAMGVILYEMLTGHVPFDGESVHEIIIRHLTDNPDLTAVPAAYRHVVQRALRKDPIKRYRNATEMLTTWQTAERDAPVRLRSAPIPAEPVLADRVAAASVAAELVDAELVEPRRGSPPPLAARQAARSYARCPRPTPPVSPTSMSGSTKLLLLVGLVLLLHFNPLLVPLAIVLGLGYLAYAGIRDWTSGLLHVGAPVRPGQWRNPVADHAALVAAVRRRLGSNTFSQRAAEWTGSLLSATFLTAVLTLSVVLLQGSILDGSNAGWAVWAWLASVSALGSWILLTLGKCWEAEADRYQPRRLSMLGAGLMIGAVAWGLGRWLMLDLPVTDHWANRAVGHATRLSALLQPDGAPLLSAYLVYFAGLFVVPRWWRQMDPVRRTRLNLWSTAVCLLWAWIMDAVCPIPQPWGLVQVGVISVVIQSAAPWISPTARVAMVQGSYER